MTGTAHDDEERPRRRAPGILAVVALAGLFAAVAVVRFTRVGDDPPAPTPTPGASATATPSPAPAATVVPTQSTTVNGQRVVVSAPTQPTTKAVIYAHGRGGDAFSPFEPGPLGEVTRTLVADGYVVAASDAHGDAWGDAASVQDQVSLAQWLRDQGKPTLYLLAESMGGLSSLQAAGTIQAKAWAGIYPVCDVSSVTRFLSEIDAVWQSTSPPGLSPVSVPPGLPVMAWASPGDTTVPKARNADVCAAGHVVSTTGDHGDPSNFDPAGVAAFFAAHP